MGEYYSALALLVHSWPPLNAFKFTPQILKIAVILFALGFEEDQIFVQQVIRNCYGHFVFIYCIMIFIRSEVQT
jgi:hypothetical protein